MAFRSERLPIGTTQATLSLTTDEAATCRYSTTAGVAYASMPNTFTTTGSTSHSRTVTGLTNGGSYTFYVRCVDGLANANADDYSVAFSVASSSTVTSSFLGAENPLSESGVWDSPGSWTDLQKNAGAFTAGLNAQGAPRVAIGQRRSVLGDHLRPGSRIVELGGSRPRERKVRATVVDISRLPMPARFDSTARMTAAA